MAHMQVLRMTDEPRNPTELRKTLLRLGHEEFGIDFLRERRTTSTAAAIAVTINVWRNTELESIHGLVNSQSGYTDAERELRSTRREQLLEQRDWAPADIGGIVDPDMFRINVDAFRHVRRHVTIEGIDMSAVHAILTDPRRLIRLGDNQIPASTFFGDQWNVLAEDIERHCIDMAATVDMLGDELACLRFAPFGMTYGSRWFGHPWWQHGVERLVAAGGRPAGSYQWEQSPPPPGDIHDIAAALRHVPNRLTHEQARWALSCCLDLHVMAARRAWIDARTSHD